MQFINKRVLLHKPPNQKNFDVLNLHQDILHHDISFIYMRDVSFILCEKNKEIYSETGQLTNHAWIEGILVDALPKTLKLNKNQLRLIDTGIPITYSRDKSSSFILTHSGAVIEEAKELIGYNGKLKVFL